MIIHIHIEDTASGQTFYLCSHLTGILKGTYPHSHHQIKTFRQGSDTAD